MGSYYVRRGKRVAGPRDGQDLKRLASSGRIEPSDEISRSPDGPWTPAWKVPGLLREPIVSKPATIEPEPVEPPPIPFIEQNQGAPLAESPPTTPLVDRPRAEGSRRRYTALLVLVVTGCFVPPLWGYGLASGFNSDLERCETYGVVEARVYYRSWIPGKEIVFDIESVSPNARRIDVVHLLLQFASRADLDRVTFIHLAHDGEVKFIVNSLDLQELGHQYKLDARLWALCNLPPRLKTRALVRAYAKPEGGALYVLKAQTEQVNDAIQRWME